MSRGPHYLAGAAMKILVFALLFSLAAAAQIHPATPKTAPAHTRTATASRPRVSDAEIEQTIRAKFAKSKISADKFTVHVQGGVATIEGKSDVVQHKGTATRLAKTGGAVAVVNKIQLSQAAKDKANKNLEKGRRRAQIKRGDARTSN
jgi:BON domain-containing protein